MVAPAPRRARLTRVRRVRRVRRLVDVAAHDVTAERVLAFQGFCNSLMQFFNTIFSNF
jgi:hypothetical protein